MTLIDAFIHILDEFSFDGNKLNSLIEKAENIFYNKTNKLLDTIN